MNDQTQSVTASAPPSAPQEIRALTSLRFIAAFYVFVFHIHIRWPLSDNPFISTFLSQGAVGMSIFFMLSGYILAYRYGAERVNLREYYVNRFAKIYPIYAVAALITVPWIGIWFADGPFVAQLVTLMKLGTLVLANIFVIQAWFPPMFQHWNNGGSWSISVEFFLYALFPVLILLLRNRSWRILLAVMGFGYVFTVLPGAVYYSFRSGTEFFYSMPIFRLAEFILGICAFLIAREVRLAPRALDCAFVTALVLGVAYLGFFGMKLPNYITHNWVVIPVIFMMLLALGNARTIAARLMSVEWMVFMGRISYCFYSFQALVILTLIDRHAGLVKRVPLFENNIALTLLAFSVLTLLSWLGYRFIEEPMRKKIRRKFANPAPSDARARTHIAYP